MDKYSIVALAVIVLAVTIIIVGIVVIHTYPGRVAKARGHPQSKAIEVTSLIGLIIFPFWLFALIWAYSDATIGTVFQPRPAHPQQPDTARDPLPDKEP